MTTTSHLDRPAVPDDLTQIMDAVRILVRAIRHHSVDVERQLGISLAQLYVLEQLAREPGCSINRLADVTRTHQSSVSVVVRKLTERALVEKRTSATDARRAELTLTEAGRELLARAPETVQARLIAGLQRLGPERTAALAQGLGGWIEACGLSDAAPPMLYEDVNSEP